MPVASKVRRELAGDPGLCVGWETASGCGDPQSCSVAQRTPRPGHRDTLVTHTAPPASGHRAPADRPSLSHTLGLLSCLPGGCCAHPQPPCSSSSSPRGLTGTGGSGTEKRSRLPGTAGAEGAEREGWGLRMAQRQLDSNPAVRAEG